MSIPLRIRQTALLLSMEMQNKSVYNESSIRQETIIRRDESHEKDGRKTTDRHPEISAGQYPSQRGDLAAEAGTSGRAGAETAGKDGTGESCHESGRDREREGDLPEADRIPGERRRKGRSGENPSVNTGRYEERGKSAGERSAEYWRYHTFVS